MLLREGDVRRWVGRVVSLVRGGARRATAYLTPGLTIKATRVGKPDRRQKSETYVVSIGRPNYAERGFIASCLKGGERFPVRKIQVKFFPKE